MSLTLDFIVLFATIFTKFALDKPFLEMQLSDAPREGDQGDFTQAGKIKTTTDSVSYLFYTQFYFVVLFYMLVMVSTFNVHSLTDCISLIYLLFGFYFLVRREHFKINGRTMWDKLRFYNILIILLLLVFQSPIFPCPFVTPSRTFLSPAECVTEFNEVSKGTLIINSYDIRDAMYAVIAQTIGFFKIVPKTVI